MEPTLGKKTAGANVRKKTPPPLSHGFANFIAAFCIEGSRFAGRGFMAASRVQNRGRAVGNLDIVHEKMLLVTNESRTLSHHPSDLVQVANEIL